MGDDGQLLFWTKHKSCTAIRVVKWNKRMWNKRILSILIVYSELIECSFLFLAKVFGNSEKTIFWETQFSRIDSPGDLASRIGTLGVSLKIKRIFPLGCHQSELTNSCVTFSWLETLTLNNWIILESAVQVLLLALVQGREEKLYFLHWFFEWQNQ